MIICVPFPLFSLCITFVDSGSSQNALIVAKAKDAPLACCGGFDLKNDGKLVWIGTGYKIGLTMYEYPSIIYKNIYGY